jgi:Ser/Thr protein kinase RdoA (MazF antagonist)
MRIHGDCHRGNLLWGNDGPFFLDFDDFLMGPAVQDVWLLIPARDAESKRDLNAMLEGYEEMRPFNRSHLALVEPLRALRSIRYSAWLAKRWDDPAFKSTFSYFDTHAYWEEKVHELREILGLLHEST